MKHARWISLAVGLVVAVATARVEAANLKVTFTTTPNGGPYAPRNIVAVWIQSSGGTFVKTIGRWANVRKQHLVAWNTAAGPNDADAISGATRLDHTAPLTIMWNLTDRNGATIPDGTYTIRMELTDLNATTAGQNHQGTFTFVKGPQPQTQTGLTNGGFINVSITYDPAAVNTCNNGVVDSGETCDPGVAGSCPDTCAASADRCMPNVLVGAAATCDAECRVQPITACAAGDGCCPDGCDETTDADCAAGGPDVTGGCETGGGAGGQLLVSLGLGLAVLAARRRRR